MRTHPNQTAARVSQHCKHRSPVHETLKLTLTACDLCFTKKIKCDMLKPVCSNCILYHAECRTSIIRRKANPPKPRAAPPVTQPEK